MITMFNHHGSQDKALNYFGNAFSFVAFFVASLLTLLSVSQVNASSVTVNVVSPDTSGVMQPVSGFRWLLEEDNTHPVTPGVHINRADIPAANQNTPSNAAVINSSLSFDFHASHAPVAVATNDGRGLQGETGSSSVVISDILGDSGDQRRYYVSVLPYEGYTMGGAQVRIDEGGLQSDAVTVVVQPSPLRTARISVFVFEDNAPINNAPDLPEEQGMGGADWNVLIFDAGGLYGVSGGQVLQDAFGHPLGTVYAPGDSGTVESLGDGTLHPDPFTGVVVVDNLVPGKYGVQVVPPASENWIQTSTIEGTKTVDAWVKSNEPPFFVEFGPPGHHVFIGFVNPEIDDTTVLTGGETISGQITNLHTSRPPNYTFYSGHPIPGCFVALNDLAVGEGRGVYTRECDENSEFTIPNVPAGNYQLVVFDKALDLIIALHGITVDAGGNCNGGSCDLVEVPVFNWFARLIGSGFFDRNQNGFRDCVTSSCTNVALDDVPMPADTTAVNLRFRNGQVYQSFPVDTEGLAPFDEVFPFFHWLVAEFDFATLKATGATFTIDDGGELGFGEELKPQPQIYTTAQSSNPDDPDFGCAVASPLVNPNTGDNLSRTETGPVLTAGFQNVIGQTLVMEFGKGAYGPNENGGVSGVVVNTVTRAEDDPRFAAAEEWEALIPRAQVNLYQDVLDNSTGQPTFGGDKIVDDINGIAGVQYADIDNYPIAWSEGDVMGPEDIERSGNDGVFDLGDAIEVTHSDSWDDSKPTGCQGDNGAGFEDLDCFDGLRNFNQTRPAVFDGGYAFGPVFECDTVDGCPSHINETNDGDGNADTRIGYLASGQYIVEGITPAGYEHIKEEDRNVDFGDQVIPQLLPAECVGDLREVPPYMSFNTDSAGDPVVADPEPAPFAGDMRALCDRKSIKLSNGQNAAADFHLMTDVPKAARVVGFILDDVANEFDPNSPNFGEKYAPPWLPVSFRDFTGKEITRVYSDEFGKYNALLPSTFTANVPMPSGMGPNMLTACMNAANPLPNPAFGTNADAPEFITDPFHNRQYSQFCYTFQYMPGSTTYLDTPVIPIAAFAGPAQFPLDCEFDNAVPVVASVNRFGADGGGGPFVVAGQRIRIRSAGLVEVPNPEYDGTDSTSKTVQRNYRFAGNNGQASAMLIDETGMSFPLTILSWNNNRINARVPAATPVGNYQLQVTRNNGNISPMGITVAVGTELAGTEHAPSGGLVFNVAQNGGGDFTTIQAAINASAPGDLILVAPGIYEELVVMYKPVALQGWGAQVVTINAIKAPGEKLSSWRQLIGTLLGNTTGNIFPDGFNGENFDLLPGQEIAFEISDNEPVLFTTEEGSGITVVSHRGNNKTNSFTRNDDPRIDGFTVTGADHGGGIFVNGYADWLQISNNRVISNAGVFGGGIRLGHANLVTEANDELMHTDSLNDRISIHHNHITQNGSLDGAGAGVAIYTGADRYRLTDNMICGNFSQRDGGGVGHLGRSRNARIERNTVKFNQSFNQGQSVSGGGLFIGGKTTLNVYATGLVCEDTGEACSLATDCPLVNEDGEPDPAGTPQACAEPVFGPQHLSAGSGSVAVIGNVIQGNLAGAGDGGGVRTQFVNGSDTLINCTQANVDQGRYGCASTSDVRDQHAWYRVDFFNNMIVNNVAGLAGGGVSFQDTARVRFTNNTVANNDSTATAGEAFTPGSPNQSNAQPAGLVTRAHSALLNNAIAISSATNNLPNAFVRGYSRPKLFRNNILWHNRSFYFSIDSSTTPDSFGLCPDIGGSSGLACSTGNAAVYDDLAVLGIAPVGLRPRFTLFSETYSGRGSSHPSNKKEPDAGLLADYVNGDRGQTIQMPELNTSIAVQPAFDEGGNFIDVRFGPLSTSVNAPGSTQPSDYHLEAGSPAIDMADPVSRIPLEIDIDGEIRPAMAWDIGADEMQ
jgi:large repetitive protein